MYMHIKQKQKTIFNSNLITKNVSHGSEIWLKSQKYNKHVIDERF